MFNVLQNFGTKMDFVKKLAPLLKRFRTSNHN